jgi:hypothetical protein
MSGNLKRKRVFVSFDYDKDKYLKDMLVGQARNPESPFVIADHSLKEAAPERNWKSKAKQKIENVDAVIVIAGKNTHKAAGVRAEVRMAKKAGVPIMQIRGRKNAEIKGVKGAGRVNNWTWKNLNRGIHKKS